MAELGFEPGLALEFGFLIKHIIPTLRVAGVEKSSQQVTRVTVSRHLSPENAG